MEKNKNKRKESFLFYMIPVVLIVAIGVFGFLFLRDFMAYREADSEYAVLEGYMTATQDTASAQESYLSAETAEASAPESTELVKPPYQYLSIDYDKLKSINDDFVGVIDIPALSIKYPVVYSVDNANYLHRTFEKKNNFAGAIFLDANAERDFNDANTFIFGHNMKNGSMFGKLKHFATKPGLVDSDPYIYIYLKDEVRKYRIFSFYRTVDGSEVYNDFDGDQGYEQYVKMILGNSSYKSFDQSTVDFTQHPRLLTLSTCTGRTDGNQRFVVHAALVESISRTS
jgi:sortase B